MKNEKPKLQSADHADHADGVQDQPSLYGTKQLNSILLKRRDAESAVERRVWQTNPRSPFAVHHRFLLLAPLRPLHLNVYS